MTSPGRKLRDLIARPGLTHAIGTHDAISSRLVEQAGFEVVYAGGAAVFLADYGLPDLGMMTMTELIDHMGRVAGAVSIPVIADLDDGGGNPLRVRRSVQAVERAGVAGFHIEDTDFGGGKHFATTDGGGRQGLDLGRDSLRPSKDFVQCVRAAVDARQNEDLMIIARTDAALHSVDEAIDRAGMYVEAGADMIFLHWVPREEIARCVKSIDAPYMCMYHDVTGDDYRQLEAEGVKLFFRPSFTWTTGFRAISDALRELKENGELSDFEGRRANQDERFKAVGAYDWTELARKYGMMD